MTVTVLHLSDREHDDFVRNHPNGHLMQTVAWGKAKEPTGWTWRRVAIGRHTATGHEVTGAALLLFRRTPLLPMALCYCPRGFVVDWSDEDSLDALLAEVRRVATANAGVTLRIDPAVRIDDTHLLAALTARGFARTDPGEDAAKALSQPAVRMVTDISDVDGLLAQLPQGTRWSIRKAQRSGLVYESAGRAGLVAFHDLLRTTGERDGFGVRSLGYFTSLFDLLSPTDDITISLVRLDPRLARAAAEKLEAESTAQLAKLTAKPASEKQERQIETLEQSIANCAALVAEMTAIEAVTPDGPYLAGSVFATCGARGSYLYAASSNDYRNLRPNYLMVWELMQRAARRGVATFDFGGIDASEGLEEFKRQWNPQRLEYAGEFTLRLRPVASRLVEALVRAYKNR